VNPKTRMARWLARQPANKLVKACMVRHALLAMGACHVARPERVAKAKGEVVVSPEKARRVRVRLADIMGLVLLAMREERRVIAKEERRARAERVIERDQAVGAARKELIKALAARKPLLATTAESGLGDQIVRRALKANKCQAVFGEALKLLDARLAA